MATAEQYAKWIVDNRDKQGTPEFETVSSAYKASRQQQPQQPQQEQGGGFMQGIGNLGAGALRGAGSIGATILSPVDAAARAMGFQNSYIGRTDRRAAMDEGLQSMGANPESGLYTTGKIGAEIAGTAGVGGALARGVQAIPAVANAAPSLAAALRSGGFSLGGQGGNALVNAATRIGAGGVVGGASAGLIDPEYAGTGAVIGAVMPDAVRVAGKVGQLARKGTGKLTSELFGLTTGTGGEAVSTAFNAGKRGAPEFLDNMRGNVQMDDVLASAKQGLSNMRADRSAQYRQGMAGITNDKTILDFAPIDAAILKIKSLGSFKGQVTNKNAAGTVQDIADTVASWKGLNPAEYHTPEGLDALKQAIGDIRDATQFGTPGRKAADAAYNAVKNEIVNQAPDYAKVMKDYSVASDTLNEIQRALSLNPKASVDTAMRKLQSLMRNNVSTNYGNRLSLARTLEDQGGNEILPALAGQAMNSWAPRGLMRPGATLGGMGAAMVAPSALALAPLTSPRLVGELAYKAGQARSGVPALVNRGMQALPQGAIPQLSPETVQSLLRTAPIASIPGIQR